MILPVWPTCSSLGAYPASTAAREAPTAAPILSAREYRILNPSALPRARPPDTTLDAVCKSGRSFLAADTEMKRVWVGSSTLRDDFSTGAEPPVGAASNEALRTVPTILEAGSVSTVTIALPA